MFTNIVNKFRSICCNTIDCKSNHVACLVKGRTKVVTSCMNDYQRQYIGRALHTTLHAEVGCLKDNKDLSSQKKKIKKNLSLLILRYRKDGSLCDSRPCSDCKTFLLNKGLLFVFCSVTDGTIQKIFLKDVPNYLSASQIQFKIYGLRPLSYTHIKKLNELGLTVDNLQRMSLHEQLDILTLVKNA